MFGMERRRRPGWRLYSVQVDGLMKDGWEGKEETARMETVQCTG